uniref:Putative ovule protein n=1 Tax=Solanum chacoense TaxID=4108 RepID=A0A0V0IJT6_SOLCH
MVPLSSLVTKGTYNGCPIGLTNFFPHNFMPGKPLLIASKILRKKIINIIFLSLLRKNSTTFSLLLTNKKNSAIYILITVRKENQQHIIQIIKAKQGKGKQSNEPRRKKEEKS